MKRKQQEDDNDDGVEKAVSPVLATTSNTMSTDLLLQSSSKLSQKQDYIFHGGKNESSNLHTLFIQLIALV